jgi:sporulation protein YlmC with PRC-barrel domain
MLQLSGMLLNRPVLSLRIGRPIATTTGPVINPNNLKIEGFYCQEDKSRQTRILLSQDIRDIMPQGIVVNDQDALSDPDELVRLKEVIALGFDAIGKQVVTATKEKIGKVTDYSVEVDGLYIQKLYVSQSLFKSLGGGTLGIDRSQIVEITDKAIVVNDLHDKVPAAAHAVA